MKKIISIIASLFFIISICCAQKLTLTTNANNHANIQPADLNLQAQWYPVFVIDFPVSEGWTDFELKGSVTNFQRPVDGNPGDELIFFYHSQAPSVNNNNANVFKYQQFDPEWIKVYFCATNIKKYYKGSISVVNMNWGNSLLNNIATNFNGVWDSRWSVRQKNNGTNAISVGNLDWTLSSYLLSPTNDKVIGVMIIVGWDKTASSTDPNVNKFQNNMNIHCKPTNTKLIWKIVFSNPSSVDMVNNKFKWRFIKPAFWINNYNDVYDLRTDF